MSGRKGSLTRRVASNAAWSGIARLSAMALNFVTVPVFLTALGEHQFGLYALIQSLLGVTGLLNLGVGEATIKYMTEHLSKGSPADSVRYFRNGLLVQLLVGLLGFLFLATVAPLVFRSVLEMDPGSEAIVSWSLLWFGVGWIVRNVNSALYTVPISSQRYDLAIAIRDGATVAERVFGLIAIGLGGGMVRLMQTQVMAQIVATALCVILDRRLMPALRLTPRFDRGALRDTLRMGTWQSIASVTSELGYTLDRWLVAVLISTRYAGYYSAVSVATTSLFGALGALGTVLFPTFTHLYASKSREKATRLFVSGTWVLTHLAGLLYVPLFLCARPFLTLWLGPEIAAETTWLLRVLIIAQLIMSASLLENVFLVGIGKTHWNALLGIVSVVLSFTISWSLISRWGILGMGWGRLAPGIVWMVGMLKMRRRFFSDLPSSWYLSGIGGALISSLVGLSLSAPLLRAIDRVDVKESLLLGMLAAVCGVGAFLWMAVCDRLLPGAKARSGVLMDALQAMRRV